MDVLKPGLPRDLRSSLVPASVLVEEEVEKVAHNAGRVYVAGCHGGCRVEHARVSLQCGIDLGPPRRNRVWNFGRIVKKVRLDPEPTAV